jgi:hypothetical protein
MVLELLIFAYCPIKGWRPLFCLSAKLRTIQTDQSLITLWDLLWQKANDKLKVMFLYTVQCVKPLYDIETLHYAEYLENNVKL